jgi:hypothetical protein
MVRSYSTVGGVLDLNARPRGFGPGTCQHCSFIWGGVITGQTEPPYSLEAVEDANKMTRKTEGSLADDSALCTWLLRFSVVGGSEPSRHSPRFPPFPPQALQSFTSLWISQRQTGLTKMSGLTYPLKDRALIRRRITKSPASKKASKNNGQNFTLCCILSSYVKPSSFLLRVL